MFHQEGYHSCPSLLEQFAPKLTSFYSVVNGLVIVCLGAGREASLEVLLCDCDTEGLGATDGSEITLGAAETVLD